MIDFTDKNLMQHNNLSFARYEMDTSEKDIMYIIISKLKKDDPVNTIYDISMKELQKITSKKLESARIKKSCELLLSKNIKIRDIEKDKFLGINVFQSILYEKGNIKCKLTEDIRPFLFDLQEKFTVYNLKYALALSSKYSKRLYEIACSRRKLKKFQMSVDEFREVLNVGNKLKTWINLRDRCLLPAIEEIREKTDINIIIEVRKKNSNKFDTLYFEIESMR